MHVHVCTCHFVKNYVHRLLLCKHINKIYNDIILYTVQGKRHDSGMLTDSGLLQELEQYSFSHTGDPCASIAIQHIY